MSIDPIKEVENLTKEIHDAIAIRGRSVFGRYPLLFLSLATFGFVATIYGFERVLDQIPLLRENPTIILLVGILILALTGTLYKRLEK